MCEWARGEDALTPTLRRENEKPPPEIIRISGGSYFAFLDSCNDGSVEGLQLKLHTPFLKGDEGAEKKDMPPKKLKNQHKRAASIGLQTVTCCDACRGPGTEGTNGREELMRAQFGLRCRGWGRCVCQRICLFLQSSTGNRIGE